MAWYTDMADGLNEVLESLNVVKKHREESWYVRAFGTDTALSIVHNAVANKKHIVTGIFAGFDEPDTGGYIQLTCDGVAEARLHFVGQIQLSGLNIEFANSVNKDVGITLTAGGAGVNGSVLLNGYSI